MNVIPAIRPSLLTLATICAIGCGEPRQNDAPPAPTPPQTVAAGASNEAAAPEGTEAKAGASPAAAVVTTYGVPECDQYVKKFLACVEERATGEEKEKLMAGFEANREKWRALSTMKEGKVAMSLACKAAAQASKEQLAVDYGCEF